VLAVNACQLIAGIDNREVAPPATTNSGSAGAPSASTTSTGSAGSTSTTTTGIGGSMGGSVTTGGGAGSAGGTGGSSEMDAGDEADAPEDVETPDAEPDAPVDDTNVVDAGGDQADDLGATDDAPDASPD
jgi:hypothetical protein